MSRDYMTAEFYILMHIHSVFSTGNEFVALNKNVICRSVILRLFHRGCDSISENANCVTCPFIFTQASNIDNS